MMMDAQDDDDLQWISLSRLNQSKVTQWLSETFPKANLISSKVSVAFLPILKQNLIHARCSVI